MTAPSLSPSLPVAPPTAWSASTMLKSAEVAKLLGTSVRTLERWRVAGTGPRFCRFGAASIRYPAADLQNFIASS
ncbi:MAG: helix-turn-helix domain-containing protein [Rhodospirillaceae bacterium]